MQKYFLLFILLFTTVTFAANHEKLSESALVTILNDPNRPVEDIARDESRLPASIMAFSGVAKGDNVLDLFAGGGWYSELFSLAVGPQGKVYIQNDEVIWRFAEKPIAERTKNNRLSNVVRLDNIAIADMQVPPASIDIAFTALNYHDMFFTEMTQDGKKIMLRDKIVDYKAALAAIKTALKDDGVLIIIDHFAKAGSGFDVANTLHRIDSNIVKFQLEEAGFKLVEEAFYLRNSEDDNSKSVFDPSIRGKTNRFVYKFVKQ
jgi:predicted methyltransferase